MLRCSGTICVLQFNETIVHQIGNIDYIVHAAAETHVERRLVDSSPFVLSNLLGTCHLLEYKKITRQRLSNKSSFQSMRFLDRRLSVLIINNGEDINRPIHMLLLKLEQMI